MVTAGKCVVIGVRCIPSNVINSILSSIAMEDVISLRLVSESFELPDAVDDDGLDVEDDVAGTDDGAEDGDGDGPGGAGPDDV